MNQHINDNETRYYLFVGEEPANTSNVIFDVADVLAASDLVAMLSDEYGEDGNVKFGFEGVTPNRLRDSIRLDETLIELANYKDPDPYLYDPRPSEDLVRRVEFGRRAARWYSALLQRRMNDQRTNTGSGSDNTSSLPDHPVDTVCRLLQKHRLMFLYFAAPGQINPMAGDERSMRIQDHLLPKIPPEKIDSAGEFLFTYKRAFEIYAQACVAKFGSEEDLPRRMLLDGTIVEIEGSSVPYWTIDEVACAHLEESADDLLEACRHLLTADTNASFALAVSKVSSVLRDRDCTKWYASKLVSWKYLQRVDEVLEFLKSLRIGAKTGLESESTTTSEKISADPATLEEHESESNGLEELVKVCNELEIPEGTSWSDIEIRFIDGETVSVRVGKKRKPFLYWEMGMVNQKNKKPTKQWELLRTLAANYGTLRWTDPGASQRNQKQKELLSARLRDFFGLSGDPIHLTPDKNGWKTEFTLVPD